MYELDDEDVQKIDEALGTIQSSLRKKRHRFSETPRGKLPADFDQKLRSALLDADARGRLGGLVPMHTLRKYLAPLGLSRDTLDKALLERLRARTLNIKIANNPSDVEDPSAGIMVEGRGLLYYVVAE